MSIVGIPMADYGGRVVSPDMFADLGVGEATFTTDDDGLHARFDAALNEVQVDAVRDRLTSRDDAQQAARAELTSLLAAAEAAPGDCAASHALTSALTAYVLDTP